MDATGVELEIPYEEIVRANLIEENGRNHERGDLEGIRTIEREKGIEYGHARLGSRGRPAGRVQEAPRRLTPCEVVLDNDGEFRVYAIDIPGDLEERLLEEAMEAKIEELERLEEETGEKQHTLINPDELDLDWSQVPEQQIHRTDVTPPTSVASRG